MTHAPVPSARPRKQIQQQHQASMPPYFNTPRQITESLERLEQLYDAWGQPAQAAEWKTKLDAFQQVTKVNDNKSKTP